MMKFCWWCGYKFGEYSRPVTVDLHGHERSMHQSCAATNSVRDELFPITVDFAPKTVLSDEEHDSWHI